MTVFNNKSIRTDEVEALINDAERISDHYEKGWTNYAFEETIDEMWSNYMPGLQSFSEMTELRQANRLENNMSQDEAEMKVISAIIAAQSSIRTETTYWDDLMNQLRRGEITGVDSVAQTTDGTLKSEKLSYLMSDGYEVIRQSARLLRQNKPIEARNYLNGRKTNDTDDTYLRTTKSNYVLWLLGYKTYCMDHRVVDFVSSDGPATTGFLNTVFNADSTGYRRCDFLHQNYTRVTQDKRRLDEPEFWHDVLKWNPEIYDYLTYHLVKVVADFIDPLREDRVTQVMFQATDDHKEVLEAVKLVNEA